MEDDYLGSPHQLAYEPDIDGEESDEGAEEYLARSRDRNREHARKTRLRKKVHMQSLQKKVKELQDENKVLRQTLEECSIASILLGLSSGDCKASSTDELNDRTHIADKTFFTVSGKRKRFVSDAGDCPTRPMKLNIKGTVTVVGGNTNRSQINWKTGVFVDEEGQQQQLSNEELETLRRERNRMHAKMTRDRKKVFISSVEKTISELEEDNKRMRDIITKQALSQSSITPEPSPTISSDGASRISSVPSLKALEESCFKSGLKITSNDSLDSMVGTLSVVG